MFCTCLACLTQSKNFAPQVWLFPWMFGRSDNYHHHKNLTCFTDMECLTQCGKSYVFYFYGRSNTNKVKTFMECLIKNQNLMCFTSLPNTRWRSDVICMYGIPDKSGNPFFFSYQRCHFKNDYQTVSQITNFMSKTTNYFWNSHNSLSKILIH